MYRDATVTASFAASVITLLEKSDVELALQLASNGVRQYPSYIGGYIVLARCYQQLGHSDAASIILDEAERRFPNRMVTASMRYRTVPAPEHTVGSVTHTHVAEEAPLEKQAPPVAPLTEENPQPTSNSDHAATTQQVSLLRIIELLPVESDTRNIRSSSMRLIPGLEYTSLRFEGAKRRGTRSIRHLPDPPAFREFHAQRIAPSRLAKAPQQRPSLENLAERIGRVRISAEELEHRMPAPAPAPSRPPALITDTLMKIYMQQERWAEALEGFKIMQANNPAESDRYQKLINECQAHIGDA